eukprot:Plantae.Rhodophyta-Purpureofilum_apyrenoidigerum.ctg24985.p1 GENE.Plantae.Rhodophyta-Purpureofilum_apyrenoidigerum.ctg24985~~Plantae.Rhodophyta-Purpureofilum_apyrenoidigerum.ctg24985.p1  ORF type:complete len:439 (+),score=76.95 Plantae.Rhodophyta-Purpureofilum_apyrenoidigerum.ctg24985:122-1318(+)
MVPQVDARKKQMYRRDNSRLFGLPSTFTGNSAKLHTLFVVVWFVLPALYLTSSSTNGMTPSVLAWPLLSNSAAVQDMISSQAQAIEDPFQPSADFGSSDGDDSNAGQINPADAQASVERGNAANPAGTDANVSAAHPDPPKPAAIKFDRSKIKNPVGPLLEPQKREQFIYNMLVHPERKTMVCLSPRAVLFPLRDVLMKRAGMIEPLKLPEADRADLFRDKSYKRIAFVRNPSTRLMSIYKAKFLTPAKESPAYKLFMEHLFGKAWVASHDIVKIERPTFTDFIEQVKQNGFDGDEVWDPVTKICGMDKAKYNLFLHTENYVDDSNFLLNSFDVNVYPPAVKNITEFHMELIGIAQEISKEDLTLLSGLYKEDYTLFGYTPGGKDFAYFRKNPPPPKK